MTRLLALGYFGALGGPLLHQARLLGLPLDDPPVLAALAVAALFAGLLAAAGHRAAPVAQAVVLVLFADATVGLRGLADDLAPAAVSPALPLVPLIILPALAALGFYRLVGPRAPALLATFYLASAAAAGVGMPAVGATAATAATAPSGRPVLLHLVLDSLQTPLAVSADLTPVPALAEAADQLVADGFHVDALLYSSSSRTEVSLPRVFDGYFDRLSAAGYRIEVFHRATPNLCRHAAVVRCATALSRPTRRVFHDLLARAEEPAARAATVAALLTRPASLLNDVATLVLARQQPSLRHFAQPLEAREVIEHAMARAASAAPGTAIVAHAMLPHHPYALDADCRPVGRPLADWIEQDTPVADAATRQRHFAAYAAQMLCALRTVRAGLTGLEGVKVVLHGDHGSRIIARMPGGGFAPLDPNLTGTMLAARATGVAPGLSSEPGHLEQRFRAVLGKMLD